ncbi:MAG: hypothetical protein ACI8X5_003084 [Planctomycetota bacterium]|jgi:hypothetical protein
MQAIRLSSSLRALAFLVCASLASCVTSLDTVTIHFSSDPPGADVVVDGVPSGFATPCMIALDKERQVITLELRGYQAPVRILFPDPYTDSWLYSEASVGPHTWEFPTFINLERFLQPVEKKNELIPARVHVRLRREADAE